MSTEYGFVDRVKLKSWENFLEEAIIITKQTVDRLEAIPVDSSLEDKKDSCITILSGYIRSLSDSVDCDDILWKEIGTCTAKRFYWSGKYGIHDVESLRLYASQHPELTIEDEYGEAITLESLTKIIKDRA